jgi:phosphatidate cytidylyltransferase
VPGANRADGTSDAQDQPRRHSNLAIRAASAVVLGPLAIAAAWFDGLAFQVVCALAAVVVWHEWAGLSAGARAGRATLVGAAALAATAIVLPLGWFGATLLCVAAGVIAVAALAPQASRAVVGAGILYAAVMLVAPVLLRGDPNFGFVAIIFLFAVVWTTDVTAYFAGRALGGPKLAPRLSPKKTWSGAAGGAVGAVVAASIVAVMAALPNIVMTALVGFGLSVVSQAGDLFESGLKRHYGAKDAGRLIPGHGGLMDRLDGFIAAALIAVLIGVARGGAEAPARGLLVW